MLRVISGKYRTRKLEQPSLDVARPTMDRVREAFFSSIQFNLEGKIFLDLFSGSGANAIEAVSRGAMKAIANDINKEAYKVINKNVETLEIPNIDVYNMDVFRLLESKKGIDVDYVYIDAPYKEYELVSKVLVSILENDVLVKKQPYVIIETDYPSKIEVPDGLILQKTKKYGKTYIMVISNNI